MSIIDDIVKQAVGEYSKFIIPILAVSIATAIVIEFVRNKIKAFKPTLEENKWYREIILPLAPFIISYLICLVTKENLQVALAAGAASGTVYQMAKGYIKRLEKEEKSEDKEET
jgi:hypothetical protein